MKEKVPLKIATIPDFLLGNHSAICGSRSEARDEMNVTISEETGSNFSKGTIGISNVTKNYFLTFTITL